MSLILLYSFCLWFSLMMTVSLNVCVVIFSCEFIFLGTLSVSIIWSLSWSSTLSDLICIYFSGLLDTVQPVTTFNQIFHCLYFIQSMGKLTSFGCLKMHPLIRKFWSFCRGALSLPPTISFVLRLKWPSFLTFMQWVYISFIPTNNIILYKEI